jgi:CHAD domain-containing protein
MPTIDESQAAFPSTAASFAAEQARRLLESLAARVDGTIQSTGTEDIHQLRVAIRKLTSVLVVLHACFPRKEAEKIRRGLKRLMKRAAAVRDLDIGLELLAKLSPSDPASLGRHLEKERAKAADGLLRALVRWQRRDMAGQWHRDLEGAPVGASFPATPIQAVAKRMLPRMAEEYLQKGRKAARARTPARELHKFRIATKKFRYTLDLFAPLYGSSADPIHEAIKDLQTRLGEINDCAVVRGIVSDRKHKGDGGFADELKKRQRKHTDEFRRHFASHLSSPSVLRRWTTLLRDPLESGATMAVLAAK